MSNQDAEKPVADPQQASGISSQWKVIQVRVTAYLLPDARENLDDAWMAVAGKEADEIKKINKLDLSSNTLVLRIRDYLI